MALASTFAVESASLPRSESSLTMTAFAAPMARALRSPATSLADPIETTVTSPPPALSTSCRAISTP